jgi:subtilisin family serine protease
MGRKMQSKISWAVVVLVVIGLMTMTTSSTLAQDLAPLVGKKTFSQKMESLLGMLVEKYLQGKAVAQDFAWERKIPFQDDRVTVILVPPLGKLSAAIDEFSLISYGVKIEARSRHLIRARVPVSILEEVAEKVSGVSYLRLPYKPLPLAVTSEGVSLIDASVYTSAGDEGQNTRVAIIDLGFIGLAAAQANGDIPSTAITRDYTGGGIESGTVHGTAVAEIVYDVAPQVQLYLINIGDEVDLENAKDYCISEGVDIVNHSVGWFNTNFTDGAGVICGITDNARANGILWVNAAGNHAKKHYQGSFTDSDGDGWHEFTPGDETNDIQLTSWAYINLFLTWDSWPITNQDYDLYLYDTSYDLVASSDNWQTGYQEPAEAFCYLAPPGTYKIAVGKYSATGDQKLKIFTFYQDLEYRTAAHSLMAPADATGVMTAAAIDQANWITGPQENFSSQGPTNDGRIKPDISAPDGVSSFTYGTRSFFGTSASSPHVAGAAALVLSAMPGLSPDQLQLYLESWAVDIGDAGKDSFYGSGRLRLRPPPIPTNLEGLIVYPNPFRPAVGHTRITFAALTEKATIRIFNIAGELVKKQDVSGRYSWDWDVKNTDGDELARAIYIWVVTNPAGEKRTGKIAIIK